MTTDVRDIDGARRDSVLAKFAAAVQEVSTRRGVKITTELVNADPPTTCDPAILAALEASAISGRQIVQEDGQPRLSRFALWCPRSRRSPCCLFPAAAE